MAERTTSGFASTWAGQTIFSSGSLTIIGYWCARLADEISFGFCNSFTNLHPGMGGHSNKYPSCAKPCTLIASLPRRKASHQFHFCFSSGDGSFWLNNTTVAQCLASFVTVFKILVSIFIRQHLHATVFRPAINMWFCAIWAWPAIFQLRFATNHWLWVRPFAKNF